MDNRKLKQEIFSKVANYYSLIHKKQGFQKGDKIHYAGRVYDEEEVINLVDCSLDFWLTAKDYAREFENKLAKFLGVSYALLVNSGSSANLLAFYTLTSPLLKDRAIKRGDEVITLAAGFPTTIAPIIQYGAIPVFVDCDIQTHNINVSELSSALSKKTKAIFIAHTLGNPFNLKYVKEFCNKNNLWLIEDNCDALGAKYDNKFTGSIGDIGTSSFYPAHHITMGEGGAVYTNNPLLKKIALSMRDWGRDCWCEGGKDNTCNARFNQQFGKLPFGYDHKYVYSHFGFNLKATEMQAAIGVAQLSKLPQFIQKRQINHSKILNGLREFENYFIFPKVLENATPSWFGFILTLKDNIPFNRNKIVEFLESKNIQTRNLFAGNMLYQPAFNHLVENVDYRIIGNLENTNKAMNDSFWLGVYPLLCDEQIGYIIDSFKEFISIYGGGGYQGNSIGFKEVSKDILNSSLFSTSFYFKRVQSIDKESKIKISLLLYNSNSLVFIPNKIYYLKDKILEIKLFFKEPICEILGFSFKYIDSTTSNLLYLRSVA
ncbi:lipopolysaccharide biosynthesis protein RfbH [Helicobacter sp. MIT 14-3879]|nr:lipopolysaccharide biosynthesis protein RfbH [Helicobacter sp. MIT 14-3879]